MDRILFVDDEELLLKGLRRMLHSSRGEWDMEFASSGAEALELMEQKEYEVVVSDMRMPGMNGNELLAEVKQRHPSTVRIILSGHADMELILDSTHRAHQYLSKPCDEDALKSAIRRCCQLRDLLDDEALVKIVSDMSTLPSLPKLYQEVVRISKDESHSLRDAGDVIAQDAGMTAKILQLVNSSFFGLPRHIGNIGDAMVFLGADTLKALVLSVKLFSGINEKTLGGLVVSDVADHNLATGTLAQRIAKDYGAEKEICVHSLFAGSLHDIGRLIIALNLPNESSEIQQLAIEQNIPRIEAEQSVLGSDHARVGAYLLRLWGLPQPIVEAVAYHPDPASYPSTAFSPLAAVHIANALENASGLDEEESRAHLARALDMEFLRAIGVADKIEEWRRFTEPESDMEAA